MTDYEQRGARIGALFFSLLAALLLSACGMMQAKTEKAAAEAKPLTDGEILAVLSAINQAEIRQAELALEKSQDFNVRSAAMTMFSDHREMQRKAQSVGALAGIEPQESELSRSITKQAQQIEQRLTKLRGSEFDQAYLESQEKLHDLAITTVQDHLMPDARNPQLKQLLAEAQPGLKHHLQQAKKSQESSTRG